MLHEIAFRSKYLLSGFYPESKHVSNCGLLDCEDPEIWQFAKKNDYAIVTFDSDFYEISLIDGHPPKIIWLRTDNATTKEITLLLKRKKAKILDFLYGEDSQELACLEID